MRYDIRELEQPLRRAMLERVELTRKRFFVQYGIEAGRFELMLDGPELYYAADEMCFRLMANIYGTDMPTEKHEYPTTWWDAFKLRWFPRWALKRWPVGMTTVLVERGVIYPQLSAQTGPGRSTAQIVVITHPPRWEELEDEGE